MSDGPRHTLETIRRALEHVSADCDRDTWVRVCAAIKSELGDDGCELAREWSARGAAFKAADFRATWKSLRPDGGVTIGTLLALAKEGGFVLGRASADSAPAPDRAAERAKREAKEEALRAAKRKRAAAEARRRFEAAREAGTSPYLARKGVGAHGVRFEADGTVLVPMRDALGELVNVQAIAPDGGKRFLPGGPAVDVLHWLGDPAGVPVVALAEGYATAASVHEATGLPVACAFNVGNLPRVARLVRAALPGASLVVCADDDRETAERTGKNPGRLAAAEVERGGRAVVAVPAPLEPGETDFNDLRRRAGLEAVAAIVRDACARHAMREAPAEGTPAAATAPASSVATDADDSGPFEVTPAGVHFVARDREGRPSRQWVCAPLEVVARTRDADGASWGYLLAFDDPDGTQKVLAVPARLLAGDGVELRARLSDEGLAIAVGPARNRLAHYIATRRPSRRVRCVEVIGWHGAAFVLPARAYGPGADEIHFQTAEERPRNLFKLAGTLDEWRNGVAARCVGNPWLSFLVAAAFAGPCLRVVGAQSGGFHYYGQSSRGKTTALAVAASVWGRPDAGNFVRSWRATANATEAVAAEHSDTFLPLDEMREANPLEVGPTSMMLANEVGKSRLRANGVARVPRTWKVLYASTGERRVGEFAADAGATVDAGVGVRTVEVPVPESGVFADLHGAADGAAFADGLRAAALRAHGVPGDAWLSFLTAHRDEARAFLGERIRALLHAWRADGDAGQTQRVAARFALVAAAGELATRAGITGWPAGEAERAARRLFDDWIAARGTRGDAEALAALRQVAGLLGQHAESYFPWWHRGADDRRPNAPKRWGMRRMVDELGNDIESRGEREAVYGDGAISEHQGERVAARFYVTASAWRDELCAGFAPNYVAGVLHRRGHLVAESDKPGARLDRKERLPGVGPARCYVVKPSIFEDPAL